MTNLELFISRRKSEVPVFARVSRALPQGRLDYRPDPNARTAAELAAAFESHAAAVDDRLGRLHETGWQKKVRFLMEGNPPWEDSLGEFCRGFLSDAIHHRGQLSTYLRPMGGKVPSIYGPSADDPGR